VSFETDVAWAAGILEGEGCFSVKRGGIVIACAMTDLDTIQRLQEIMGGYIGKTVVRENRKDCYPWFLSFREDVIRWCVLLLPYMSMRRTEKIRELFTYHETHVKGRPRKNAAKHGSSGMYTNHKCRCDICSAGWKEYRRKRLESGKFKHGTTGYALGCRCAVCSKASRESKRERDRRKRNAVST